MPKGKQRSIIAACYLLIWQLASMAVGSDLLFPSPWRTLKSLIALLTSVNFYFSAGTTLLRVLGGFLLGVLSGTLLGVVSASFAGVAAFLSPLRHVLRSTPVTSFIVLVLLYLSNTLTSFFIPAVMVTPILWASVQAGIENTDKQLLEMAKVYRFSFCGSLKHIYFPAVLPQFLAASTTALGIAWKSGIAAEVIATPLFSIGKSIYECKIYLETPELFAWTAAVILLSIGMEKLILSAFSHVRENRAAPVRCASLPYEEGKLPALFSFENVTVKYGEQTILSGASATLQSGERLALFGASGSGKTTLLRALAELEALDGGKVGIGRCAYVFQEDRLIPTRTALQNVALVCEDGEKAKDMLALMELDKTSFEKLPSELSGGMRRRVALARALAFGGDTLLLDEAFTGLDEDSKRSLIKKIRPMFSYQVIATHDQTEAEELHCTKYLHLQPLSAKIS